MAGTFPHRDDGQLCNCRITNAVLLSARSSGRVCRPGPKHPRCLERGRVQKSDWKQLCRTPLNRPVGSPAILLPNPLAPPSQGLASTTRTRDDRLLSWRNVHTVNSVHGHCRPNAGKHIGRDFPCGERKTHYLLTGAAARPTWSVRARPPSSLFRFALCFWLFGICYLLFSARPSSNVQSH